MLLSAADIESSSWIKLFKAVATPVGVPIEGKLRLRDLGVYEEGALPLMSMFDLGDCERTFGDLLASRLF